MKNKPFYFNFLEILDYKGIKRRNTDPLKLIEQLNLDKKVKSNENPKILILTKKTDLEADLLGIQFLKHGLEYIKILEEDIPVKFRHSFSTGIRNEFTIQSGNRRLDLKDIRVVLFRYFDLKFLNYLSDVYHIYYIQQWYHTFLNFQRILNCTWINDPQMTMKAENRLNQLMLAQDLGFKIPNTTITNDPIEAKMFLKKNPKSTLVKVLHHHEINIDDKLFRFLSTKIDKNHLSKFEELIYAPVIFQSEIKKQSEFRITIVGNKLFACEITATDKNYTDLHTVNAKNLKYKEVNLDKNLSHLCFKFNKELGLLISSIDLIVDKKGDIYFLEVNPIGDWNWIEKHINLPITNSVFNLIHNYLTRK